MSAPVERQNVYGRTTFKFTDTVRGSLEASVMKSSSDVADVSALQPEYGRDDQHPARQRVSADAARACATARHSRRESRRSRRSRWAASHVELGRDILRGRQSLDAFRRRRSMARSATTGAGRPMPRTARRTTTRTSPNHLIEPNWRAALDTVVENGQIICRMNSTVAANIAIVNGADLRRQGGSAGLRAGQCVRRRQP